MKTIEIYKELRRHRKLAERRNMGYEQNKTAKAVVWIGAAVTMLYLVFLSVLLSLTANESHGITAVELMCGITPFILAIDFAFRFMMQQTPAQIIKPYILLPLRRYTCVNSFILQSLLSTGNLVWFFVLVPYSIMSVVFGYGLVTTALFLLLFWVLIMANSQWYAIVRTLINDSMAYWLLPVAVYAVAFSPWYIGADVDIERLLDCYAMIGTATDNHSLLPLLSAILILALLAKINQRVQYSHITKELSRTEKTPLHNVSRFSFLDRYGEKGLFLQLEIKTLLRNKNPRKTFISATLIVIMITLLSSFTDVYDSETMQNFWCIYNFVIYGAVMLVRIMCYEGNYIDGLMVRKENILSMLNAKYDFYCILLLLPFVLMLPTVVSGKWSIWMLLSFALFSAGFQYFVVFQLAVYNKQSIPLNTKFIGKGGLENNYIQILAEMIVMFFPLLVISVAQSAFGTAASYIIISLTGCVFIALRPLWMRNIYNRLMQRRYANMESFRSSR